MPQTTDEDLRFPTGRFRRPEGALPPDERAAAIARVAALPGELRAALSGLDAARLDTPYRPGGWTVRQVAHHVPDSHLNAYVRFKLALTEETPTIKPYDEGRWAELPDTRDAPVEVSLAMLDALHARWVALLRAMRPEEFGRTLRHPDHAGLMTLDVVLALYAWHGAHHVAHVTRLREREAW